MNLLFHEFQDYAENSYNGRLKELVRRIRYLRAHVPADDFVAAGPELRLIETDLQRRDLDFGKKGKYSYIQEIIKQLEEFDAIEDNLLETIKLSINPIISTLYHDVDPIAIKDLDFEYQVNDGVPFLEYRGWLKSTNVRAENTIKNIVQFACYKNGVAFVEWIPE
jgi:hypothetical protein